MKNLDIKYYCLSVIIVIEASSRLVSVSLQIGYKFFLNLVKADFSCQSWGKVRQISTGSGFIIMPISYHIMLTHKYGKQNKISYLILSYSLNISL